jgi:hypothetical protein
MGGYEIIMANTGIKWGSYAFAQISAADWDGVAINDDAGQLSDALDIDLKVPCQIGITIVEDNTGAVVANSVTIAILTTPDGTNWEDPPGLAGAQVGSPYKFVVTPVQNDTVYITFAILAGQFGPDPKIYILNESGQQLVVDVKYRTADVPVAS